MLLSVVTHSALGVTLVVATLLTSYGTVKILSPVAPEDKILRSVRRVPGMDKLSVMLGTHSLKFLDLSFLTLILLTWRIW